MIRFSAGLVAVFGVSFLIGTYANTALGGLASPAAASAAQGVRGDRLAAVPAPGAQHPVATVEVVGLDGATVILRDKAGEVVFRHDGARNTTLVSRDVDVPVITVRQRPGEPVARETPRKPTAPTKRTPGCEGVVSSLVKSEVASRASLCLT
ncbi:MAG TPA: hypothetical protein VEA41_12610 [Salinarimonas sp.]|jgi:hypothetical protein|nr:hypothetical protein [Salinarimonas sp.]